MNLKETTEKNRLAWNKATAVHRTTSPVDWFSRFHEPGCNALDERITAFLRDIGLNGKHVAQVLCNNGREALSLMNLGAKSATGFDISDEAIEQAKKLAEIAKLDATFVRSDLFDIDPKAYGPFDLIYISVGALCWLPDLDRAFQIISKMCKRDGNLVIYEMHPVCNMLAIPGEPEYKEPLHLSYDYFSKEVWVSEEGLDYYGHTKYDSSPSYDYSHSFAEILSAMAHSGFRLEALYEYPEDISNILKDVTKAGNVPLSYILHATKDR